MKCLHGEPCAQSTTEKGTFLFCNQNPSCNLICSDDENYLYEKAIGAWKSTKQPQPRCEKHGKLAKIRAVKNLLKSNYGRPFFVCSEQTNTCSFWVWGDVQPVAKPKCRHGSQCAVFPLCVGPTTKSENLWRKLNSGHGLVAQDVVRAAVLGLFAGGECSLCFTRFCPGFSTFI